MNRRILTLVISLFILFALPTISLYYSYQGSQLRKKALAELTVKSTLPDLLSKELKTDGRYRLILSNCGDSLSIKELIDQFIEEKLDFVFVNDSLLKRDFTSNQITKWNKIRPLIFINQSDFKLTACEIVLSNGKQEVLNTYNLQNIENRKKLIEHVAFLITKK